MNRQEAFGLTTLLVFGLACDGATAQQKSLKDEIVGTWTLTSWEQTRTDGSKNLRFGSTPKGINTFDPTGHFTLIIARPDLPKLSSNDPEKPTPDEAMAIARGSIAYFGTYTIDEATKTVTERIEGTTLVNQLAVDQKRVVTSIGPDEMKYLNSAAIGGGKIELTWKRVK